MAFGTNRGDEGAKQWVSLAGRSFGGYESPADSASECIAARSGSRLSSRLKTATRLVWRTN
jgi:hypothetical protein